MATLYGRPLVNYNFVLSWGRVSKFVTVVAGVGGIECFAIENATQNWLKICDVTSVKHHVWTISILYIIVYWRGHPTRMMHIQELCRQVC